MKTLGLALILVACWGPKRPEPPRSDPKLEVVIEHAELPNGLRLVVVPEPSAGEVAITVRYGAGAVDDPTGREGLAHLAEHVMFEPVLDALATTALSYDGATTLDSTVYVDRVARDQLAAVLALEAQRLTTACDSIAPTAFLRQREVVRNELRERRDADDVQAAIAGALFGREHPFARRSTPETIAAITQADVCAFVAQHYAPNNAVVVISGTTTRAEAQPLVEAAFAAIEPRAVVTTSVAAPVPAHRGEVRAPVARDWVVIAWPLPADPVQRARVRAVVTMLGIVVRAGVNGLTSLAELGSGTARMIALTIAPSDAITPADAIGTATYQLAHTNAWFGSGLFEHAANRAIYSYVASLDHSLDRDRDLADEAASGHAIDLIAPIERLRALGRSDAHDLVERSLNPEAATILQIHPSATERTPAPLVSTFREDRPRHPEDPALAHQAATVEPAPEALGRARRETLANGLQLVLVPLSTAPTVDIRLVFPTGSGDEPRHGLAILAAEGVSAEDDILDFIEAGGAIDPDVGFDHTAFGVTGLASQLDPLLHGLAGNVREGTYDEDARDAVRALNQAATHGDRSLRVAEDAWRMAIYGARHPYVDAGQWSHADQLGREDLYRYRNARFVPIGATLIVTGNFDLVAAERWINYYFSEWHGSPQPRAAARIALQPLAFSQVTSDAQLTLRLAFPAPRDRATALVVTEMLDEASTDVREELGASYGVHAQLVEHRLGSTIELWGRVDAARAGEACALLRERIAHLTEDEARFVAARRRVSKRERSIDMTASGLADRYVAEAALGYTLYSDPAALRLDQLSALEVARSALLVRGPAAAIAAALAAFGRSATPLK